VVKEIRAFDYSYLPSAPRFVATNEDIIRVDQMLGDSVGGVFVDEEGRVQALLMSYSYAKSNGSASQNMEGLSVDSVRTYPSARTHDPAQPTDCFCPAQIESVVTPLCRGEAPALRTLDVEWIYQPLATARVGMKLGVRRTPRPLRPGPQPSRSPPARAGRLGGQVREGLSAAALLLGPVSDKRARALPRRSTGAQTRKLAGRWCWSRPACRGRTRTPS
jgi:hypothetical protein